MNYFLCRFKNFKFKNSEIATFFYFLVDNSIMGKNKNNFVETKELLNNKQTIY